MTWLHWLEPVCVQTNCGIVSGPGLAQARVQPQVLWEFYNFLVGQGPETEPGDQGHRGVTTWSGDICWQLYSSRTQISILNILKVIKVEHPLLLEKKYSDVCLFVLNGWKLKLIRPYFVASLPDCCNAFAILGYYIIFWGKCNTLIKCSR